MGKLKRNKKSSRDRRRFSSYSSSESESEIEENYYTSSIRNKKKKISSSNNKSYYSSDSSSNSSSDSGSDSDSDSSSPFYKVKNILSYSLELSSYINNQINHKSINSNGNKNNNIKNDQSEIPFWKVFKNSFLFSKIFSNFKFSQSISYDRLINANHILNYYTNGKEILKDKIKNKSYLNLYFEYSIFEIAKHFKYSKNNNGDDKSFLIELFNNYSRIFRIDDIIVSSIKSSNLLILKILTQNYGIGNEIIKDIIYRNYTTMSIVEISNFQDFKLLDYLKNEIGLKFKNLRFHKLKNFTFRYMIHKSFYQHEIYNCKLKKLLKFLIRLPMILNKYLINKNQSKIIRNISKNNNFTNEQLNSTIIQLLEPYSDIIENNNRNNNISLKSSILEYIDLLYSILQISDIKCNLDKIQNSNSTKKNNHHHFNQNEPFVLASSEKYHTEPQTTPPFYSNSTASILSSSSSSPTTTTSILSTSSSSSSSTPSGLFSNILQSNQNTLSNNNTTGSGFNFGSGFATNKNPSSSMSLSSGLGSSSINNYTNGQVFGLSSHSGISQYNYNNNGGILQNTNSTRGLGSASNHSFSRNDGCGIFQNRNPISNYKKPLVYYILFKDLNSIKYQFSNYYTICKANNNLSIDYEILYKYFKNYKINVDAIYQFFNSVNKNITSFNIITFQFKIYEELVSSNNLELIKYISQFCFSDIHKPRNDNDSYNICLVSLVRGIRSKEILDFLFEYFPSSPLFQNLNFYCHFISSIELLEHYEKIMEKLNRRFIAIYRRNGKPNIKTTLKIFERALNNDMVYQLGNDIFFDSQLSSKIIKQDFKILKPFLESGKSFRMFPSLIATHKINKELCLWIMDNLVSVNQESLQGGFENFVNVEVSSINTQNQKISFRFKECAFVYMLNLAGKCDIVNNFQNINDFDYFSFLKEIPYTNNFDKFYFNDFFMVNNLFEKLIYNYNNNNYNNNNNNNNNLSNNSTDSIKLKKFIKKIIESGSLLIMKSFLSKFGVYFNYKIANPFFDSSSIINFLDSAFKSKNLEMIELLMNNIPLVESDFQYISKMYSNHINFSSLKIKFK